MAMWSVYTICLRWRPPGLHLLTFLFVIACIGDLCMLPFFLGELAFGRHMTVTLPNIAALVSVALFSSVLAYIFWNHGVEQVGAKRRRGCSSTDAGVRRRSGVALSRRAAGAVPCRGDRADPHRHLDHQPPGAAAPCRPPAGTD